MNERPEQMPEGRLIGLALKRSPHSARKAAELAGLSEGRWRQIVSSYQTISKGVYAPVRAPAETVARMAKVVGVTPEQLDEAGRPDAAEELRRLISDAEDPRTAKELVAELRDQIAELRVSLDRRLGDQNRTAREALIGGLEAIVEESTSDSSGR